jgi:hypothetical protein
MLPDLAKVMITLSLHWWECMQLVELYNLFPVRGERLHAQCPSTTDYVQKLAQAAGLPNVILLEK